MIKYRRWSTVRSSYPAWDYQIELDGKPVGHVMADQASRQSGTTSRWYAQDPQGHRFTRIHGTFGRLKEEVAEHFASLAALQQYDGSQS